MITPSHIIYGWAAGKALDERYGIEKWRVYGMMLGGVLPDIPAYSFFVFYTFIVGASQQQMWDVLYFDSPFSPFITLSHSFILWPILLALGYAFARQWLLWISAGAILHSAMDFLVHNDDAYMHFWPLSDWKFFSPISYWDWRHYGDIVGMVDTVAVIFLVWWFSRTMTSWKRRALVYGVAIFYLSMTILPWLVFANT